MQIDNTLALNAYNGLQTSAITKAKSRDKISETDAKEAAKFDAKLKEQTDAFESFMIKSVLDISLKEDEGASLFPKAAGSDIYKSMYNDTMSRALSGNLGFSELLYGFLKRDS